MRRDDERDPQDVGAQNVPDWNVNSGQTVYVWRRARRFVPPTDVIELPDRLVVRVEIAGLAPDAFSITLVNRRLLISGRRERPDWNTPQRTQQVDGTSAPPTANPAYHRVEIGYGEFRVEIGLPFTVRADAVTADYREGMLQVELPRLPDGQIRIVNVGSAANDETNKGRDDE